MRQPKNKGEYYLTDAFQYMVDHGAKLKVVEVAGWYDAGQVDTMIETNRVMLEKGRARRPAAVPARIDDHRSRLHRGRRHARNATVGPNVSVSEGTVLDEVHRARLDHRRGREDRGLRAPRFDGGRWGGAR